MITSAAIEQRTVLEQLTSEAYYRLRETLAVFPHAVILRSEGARAEALAELVRREKLEIPVVDTLVDHGAVISADHEPPDCSGAPFGWRDRDGTGTLMIYPLAHWNAQAVQALRGTQNDYSRALPIVKVCVVGDSDSGKTDMIDRLVDRNPAPPATEIGPRYLWTDSRLMILRETRGKHASDLAVIAAGWESERAVLTVDAAVGVNAVVRRLLFLLALSGVPQLVVAVTRLDATPEPEKAYEKVLKSVNHLLTSTTKLALTGVIPLDAPTHSWYRGESLKAHLERVVTPNSEQLEAPRLSVLAKRDGRLFGHLYGGSLSLGDSLVGLPSGDKAQVEGLWLHGAAQGRLVSGDLAALSLDRAAQLDVGDWLVREESYPIRSSELDCTLLWLGSRPPQDPRSYRLYHCGRMVDAQLAEVTSCLQPDSYEWSDGDTLDQGKVGHVSLTTGAPIYFDSFFHNRRLGRFLLLDREHSSVVGVGILRGRLVKRQDVTSRPERLTSEHVVVDPTEVSLKERRKKYGHRGAVLWFTGLSGSGKSAVAKETEKSLFERGCHTLFLDGDNVRTGINGDLGFTQEERSESTRRVAELAALVHEQGQIVICSFISGNQEDRDFARSLVRDDFFLCYVDCPVEVCRERDPKGLYEKAEAGELLSFSGVSLAYDEPRDADLILDSTSHDPATLSRRVIALLEEKGVV